MPEQLSGQLIHVTGTPPWLLRPVKVSTSCELYPDYFRLPTFRNVQASRFLILLTQSVRLPSLCSTCVTYRTPCHAIGHLVLPTQPIPREAEDFPRGDKYFKHVPALTYLIYFSPKEYEAEDFPRGDKYFKHVPPLTYLIYLSPKEYV